MNGTDLNAVIAEHAGTLARKLTDAAARGGLEVDLVFQTDAWLRDFAEAAGIHWHVEPERRVVFDEKVEVQELMLSESHHSMACSQWMRLFAVEVLHRCIEPMSRTSAPHR